MNQQLQQLFTNLDAIAGKMDAALADAEAFGPAGRSDLMLPHVNKAHDLTAAYGRLLRDAAAWDRGGQQGDIQGSYARSLGQKTDASIPPGEVMDVGTLAADQGAFDGTLNPLLMSGPNWGYFAKQDLGSKAGHIFDRQFRIGDPSKGADNLYDSGTLGQFQNVADPIVRDAAGNQVADLSSFG